MEFRFLIHSCPQGDWQSQVADALQLHVQLQSRNTVPGIWKITDRLNQIPRVEEEVLRKRRLRQKIYGVILLALGLFLLIPGLMRPKELFVPLCVGFFSTISGLFRLLPRRKQPAKRYFHSADVLLKNRSAVQDASVTFAEGGIFLGEEPPVTFDRIGTLIETADCYLLTWDDQVLLLFKQELQELSSETFSSWLAERLPLHKV